MVDAGAGDAGSERNNAFSGYSQRYRGYLAANADGDPAYPRGGRVSVAQGVRRSTPAGRVSTDGNGRKLDAPYPDARRLGDAAHAGDRGKQGRTLMR